MMMMVVVAWHETDLYSGNGRLSYNKGWQRTAAGA